MVKLLYITIFLWSTCTCLSQHYPLMNFSIDDVVNINNNGELPDTLLIYSGRKYSPDQRYYYIWDYLNYSVNDPTVLSFYFADGRFITTINIPENEASIDWNGSSVDILSFYHENNPQYSMIYHISFNNTHITKFQIYSPKNHHISSIGRNTSKVFYYSSESFVVNNEMYLGGGFFSIDSSGVLSNETNHVYDKILNNVDLSFFKSQYDEVIYYNDEYTVCSTHNGFKSRYFVITKNNKYSTQGVVLLPQRRFYYSNNKLYFLADMGVDRCNNTAVGRLYDNYHFPPHLYLLTDSVAVSLFCFSDYLSMLRFVGNDLSSSVGEVRITNNHFIFSTAWFKDGDECTVFGYNRKTQKMIKLPIKIIR